MLSSFAKVLMVLGVVLFIGGAALYCGSRLGLGNLPGDIAWRRGNTSVYIPIVSSIVASIVLTIVLNILLRLFR